MRRFSAAVRFAYNRLLGGRDRKELKRGDGPLCTGYADDAILKAQGVLDSARELGVDPRKVVFGGKRLFLSLQKKHDRKLLRRSAKGFSTPEGTRPRRATSTCD